MRSTRRNFLKKLGIGTTSLSITSPILATSCSNQLIDKTEIDEEQVLRIGDDIAWLSQNYIKH